MKNWVRQKKNWFRQKKNGGTKNNSNERERRGIRSRFTSNLRYENLSGESGYDSI